MPLDGIGLRILTDEECYLRLSTVRVGRIGLSWQAMPLILPALYQLRDHSVVLHTTRGTTLDRASDGTVVAFEVEGPPAVAEPTWSVVATGLATHQEAWPPSDHGQLVQVEIDIRHLSGREVLDGTDPMAPVTRAALPRW